MQAWIHSQQIRVKQALSQLYTTCDRHHVREVCIALDALLQKHSYYNDDLKSKTVQGCREAFPDRVDSARTYGTGSPGADSRTVLVKVLDDETDDRLWKYTAARFMYM